MERAVKNFNNLLNVSFLIIALDVLVGLLFLFQPDMVDKISIVVVGSLCLVHGLYALIDYFYVGMLFKFFQYKFIPGIFLILLGIFVIINPIRALNMIVIGVVLWLLCVGIENLVYAIRLWKCKEEISPLILFIAVCSLLMALLIAINPFSSFMLITKLIGMFIVASGLLDIVKISLFRKRSRDILKEFK